MLRTEELQGELAKRSKDVLERRQAVQDRKEAEEDREEAAEDREDSRQALQHANEALKTEVAARAQAETDLDRLFNSSPDMMVMGGFDGMLKRVNPAMVATTGHGEDKLLNTPFADLCHPDDLADVATQMKKMTKGEHAREICVRIRHKDGNYLFTEWTQIPFVDSASFLAIGRNISERIALEESLRRTLAP